LELFLKVVPPMRWHSLSAASFFFLCTVSIAPAAWAENGATDKSHPLTGFVDSKKIALDPILLQTDDIKDFDFNQFSPLSLQDAGPQIEQSLSALEKIYSDRLKHSLRQFGYDLFEAKAQPNASNGAAQDSYILEPGDEVNVVLRGQQIINTTTTITNDGQLVVADLPPVAAAGRSIKTVQDELRAYAGTNYNTDIYLSVTKIRQLSILVTGNVESPGQITLNTFQTLTDALTTAGGVKKSGTLRQIKLVRNNQTAIIDLYGILIYGSGSSDLSLRDGDKIIVGSVGPTLAIAGDVKQPAIYEILPASRSLWRDEEKQSQKLSLNDLLDLSGGSLVPAKTRYLHMSINGEDSDTVADVPNPVLRVFGDGDILYVEQADQKSKSRLAGSIELRGATPTAGLFSLLEAPSLSYLFQNRQNFSEDTYPLIGVIERWNSDQLANEIIPFSPQQVLDGKDDVTLSESDIITLFSRTDIRRIKTPIGKDWFEPQVTDDGKDTPQNAAAALSENIRNFLIEHSVFIRGAVRNTGSYPVAGETTLEALLAVAGGTTIEANLKNIEITQPLADKTAQRSDINLVTTPASLITLHPGDTVRVNQKFQRIEDRHVLLSGEIKNPGTYDLIAGDTLSSLIHRAGGLSEQSYPEGAIFSRKSERQREESQFKAQAQSLELSLAAAMQQNDKDKKPALQDISLAQDLIARLKATEALGRLTVEADPTILAAKPELDILLESGDRIFIPKRPLTVRVAGEVLSPASLQFRSGKTPRDYIDEAGGFAYNADSDRAFVVFPNGSAQPLAVSAWNQKAALIPPGSTIIVPRDPKPLTFMDGAKDLSQILANLATTAIFAEDIADGD
jgi:polysaccharide export outer membrane protein